MTTDLPACGQCLLTTWLHWFTNLWSVFTHDFTGLPALLTTWLLIYQLVVSVHSPHDFTGLPACGQCLLMTSLVYQLVVSVSSPNDLTGLPACGQCLHAIWFTSLPACGRCLLIWLYWFTSLWSVFTHHMTLLVYQLGVSVYSPHDYWSTSLRSVYTHQMT